MVFSGARKAVSRGATWLARATDSRWITGQEIGKTMAAAGYITITKQIVFLNQQELTDNEMVVIDSDPYGVANRLHSIVIRFLTIVDDDRMREVVKWYEACIEWFEIYIVNLYFDGSYIAYKRAIEILQERKLREIVDTITPNAISNKTTRESTIDYRTVKVRSPNGQIAYITIAGRNDRYHIVDENADPNMVEPTMDENGNFALPEPPTLKHRYIPSNGDGHDNDFDTTNNSETVDSTDSDDRLTYSDIRKKLSQDEIRTVLNSTAWFKKQVRFVMALTKKDMVDIRPVILYSGIPMSNRIGGEDMRAMSDKAKSEGPQD